MEFLRGCDLLRNKKSGHFFALLTVFIWGATYTSTKVLLENLSPIEILLYRFLIAYFLLFILYPKLHKIRSLKEECLFLGAGFTGVMLFFLIENIALQYTLASNVGILVSTSPLLTALIAYKVLKEGKLSKSMLIGFGVTMSGVILLIGNFALTFNPTGDLLALSAAIIWSVYSILLKKLGNSNNYIYITRKVFFYGLITMIPILIHTDFSFDSNKLFVPDVLANLFFLSFGASALCFVWWNIAIQTIGVVRTNNYIYLVPLFTVATASVVLNEQLTGASVVGALFIVIGLYVSENNFNKVLKVFKNKLKINNVNKNM